jgi:Recombinase.
VLQYAGTYFWNKEDHKTIGRRFKPKDQWIRVDNAHPAIITQEEAERVIALNRQRHRERPKLWIRKLNYLLSGDNIFGEPLFRCARCGGRMVGHNPNPGRAARKYICSTAINKGPLACIWKGVPVDALEQELITRIVQSLNDAELERYTQALKETCAEEKREIARQQATTKARLREIEQELNRLLSAIAKGLDEELAIRKISALKEEHMELQRTVAAIEKAADELSISLDQIRVTRDDMLKALQSDDIETKRRYIAGVISYMEYDPDTDNITVHLFPNAVAILNVATPRVKRVADVRFGTGARDRTWVLKRTALSVTPAATAGHRYEQREVPM